MIIRDPNIADLAAVADIHSRIGYEYPCPPLDHPLWLVRKVAEDETGVTGACFVRLIGEGYLWLDPKLGPREKMKTMQELNPVVLSEAWSKGLDEIEARLPETTERRFHKRFAQLGWSRFDPSWTLWTVATHA